MSLGFIEIMREAHRKSREFTSGVDILEWAALVAGIAVMIGAKLAL
jgi:hypothetical protein